MGETAQDDVFTLPFLTPLPRFESGNPWSLGQLFAGFMQHYDRNFDFTADVEVKQYVNMELLGADQMSETMASLQIRRRDYL